ncbi:MAG: hypothetical protein B7Z62_08685, partial [Deltaproteobacteria bacterium 37-65-8]
MKDKKRTISEDDLLKLIDGDISSARSHSDQMSQWRQKMFDEYRALPYGNEKEGRSKIVATDIQDAIEWIMPSLMRIFAGSQSSVAISGVGPEDEPKARAVSALVYYQLQKKNPYFEVIYCWFKNALRFKTSLVKATWKYDYETEETTYKDVTAEEFMLLQSDPWVEIVDAKPAAAPSTAPVGGGMPTGMPPSSFESIRIREKNVLFDGPLIENVRPETFYIDPEATSVRDA